MTKKKAGLIWFLAGVAIMAISIWKILSDFKDYYFSLSLIGYDYRGPFEPHEILILLLLLAGIVLVIVGIRKLLNTLPIIGEGDTGNWSGGSADSAEQVKKCKKLLDNGAITQQEFDMLKSKLLDRSS